MKMILRMHLYHHNCYRCIYAIGGSMRKSHLTLKKIEIAGYKSIRSEGESIHFGDITLLLGANGSGKSNLVSFFRLLKTFDKKELQKFIAKQGGASSLLYYGPKATESINFTVDFEDNTDSKNEKITYVSSLSYAVPDRLVLDKEKVFYQNDNLTEPIEYNVSKGADESQLTNNTYPIAKKVRDAFVQIQIYQFHDTSDTAKIKTSGYVDDCRILRSDAGNLAAFLKAMKENANYKRYFERIETHVRRVMTQFKHFDLETISENRNNVRLNWVDETTDILFGPHQISDGSLRFMALTTLLLQPPEMCPHIIVLDEPELGLHPSAIAELAGMIHTASEHCQIIIATQSPRLVDEFSLGDIVIVERDEKDHCSHFRKLDQKQLKDWISRYSLSELWEKNVLGGHP